MTQPADKTAALLAALWLRIRPIVEERLASLDRAVAALQSGALTVEMREEASGVAHKLAGSLGMYGFDQGTRIAREIETLFDYATPDTARLVALTRELRSTLAP